MTSHCFVNPSLANVIVAEGWDSFHDLALKTYDVAIAAIGTQANYQLPPAQPLTITYDLQGYTPGTFVPPSKPTRTISAFTMPPLPATVSLGVTALASTGPAPEAPVQTLVYAPPGGAPGDFTAVAPDPTVALDPVVIADMDAIVLPTVPALRSLPLPVLQPLNLVPFDGQRPVIDFGAPALTFGFTETAYSSDVLAAVQARLLRQSQGGTGLPAAIESALFDRARRRLDGGLAAQVQGVAEDFSARGFTEPPWVMARRMAEVRQNVQDQGAVLSGDLLIRASDLEREQLRDFVAQGIALEQVLLGAHMQREQRAFDAARYLMQAAIDLFNARLQQVNAESSLYATDASVYRERLAAEAQKVEIFKAELEGLAAIGQLNEQDIRIYSEQVRGVLAMVDIYTASVKAAEARNAINTQRLEAKRLELTVFSEQAHAYEVQWEGYGKRVDASLGVLRGQELVQQAYGTAVSAWQTKENVAMARHQGSIAEADLRLRGYLGDLDRFARQLSGETGRMGAESQALAAEASVYEAGGRVAEFASSAADRSFELRLKAADLEGNLLLQAGRENLGAGIERSRLILESLRGIATVATQLAGSLASATNLSASINAGTSESHSCAENFSFQGEIADA